MVGQGILKTAIVEMWKLDACNLKVAVGVLLSRKQYTESVPF